MRSTKNSFEGPGVYAIINKRSRRRYIGSSQNISQRIKQHFQALRIGTHCNKALLDDYRNGDDFYAEILLKLPCDTHEELMKQEALAISEAQRLKIELYNVARMNGNYYLPKDTITRYLADYYCREHLGMNIGQLFSRCEADYNMIFRILENPEREKEIRAHFAPAINYQNKDSYYRSEYGISYSDYYFLSEEEQKQIRENGRRKSCQHENHPKHNDAQ